MSDEENSSQQSAVGGQQPNPKSEIEDPKLYDPSARNRFEYEVREGGQKFDCAHVFGPLTDERYMKLQRDLKIKGTSGDDVTNESLEAACSLWDDIIVEVENIDYPEGSDWKKLIPTKEKSEAIDDLLAVAIVEPEETVAGKRRLGETDPTQIIVTEAWFNMEAVKQVHTLKAKSFELEKKYDRINGKQFQPEKTRGLKRKAKMQYVPQQDKLGALYDEMWLKTEGFGNDDDIPLRFKVQVITYIFAPTLDQKKLGK